MPTRMSGFAPVEARRLVLVRHGRTAWNLARRAQGHTDIPLDEVGHAQARRMAPLVADMRPARIWTSDLARAAQTAAYIGECADLPVETDRRLREYSVGERTGLTRAEFAERFPREYAAWAGEDETVLLPGAESTADVLARMVPALRGFVAALTPTQVGVVVTHGACLRAAMLELVDLPRSADAAFATMGNCTWTVLQETELGGRLRIAGYNEGVQGHDFSSDDEVG
ncbi:MAG: histidine phosphatase family protein [Actinomycetales bacterium]|nr:MAG: histidine phosphatase family protein [Actinomycetales bacterium]